MPDCLSETITQQGMPTISPSNILEILTECQLNVFGQEGAILSK